MRVAIIQTWLTASSPTLPPGSYPVEHLITVLPPHAAQWLATEVLNGKTPIFDVVASPAYDWDVVGEHPVLAVLDRCHGFPQCFPTNR
ncbi:MAG: hypothetical protein AB7G75_09165 [Candidatus Binatia bacterium]